MSSAPRHDLDLSEIRIRLVPPASWQDDDFDAACAVLEGTRLFQQVRDFVTSLLARSDELSAVEARLVPIIDDDCEGTDP